MKKWTAVMLLIALLIFGSVIGFNLFKNHMMAQYFANMPIPTFPVSVQAVKPADWTRPLSSVTDGSTAASMTCPPRLRFKGSVRRGPTRSCQTPVPAVINCALN